MSMKVRPMASDRCVIDTGGGRSLGCDGRI